MQRSPAYDLGLCELAPIALRLELIAEEAAEAVNDDQIVRSLASRGSLDHCLELGAIVVRRRSPGLSEYLHESRTRLRGTPDPSPAAHSGAQRTFRSNGS